MDSFVQTLLSFYFSASSILQTVFGLSQFPCKNDRFYVQLVLFCAGRILIIILYPISCLKLLNFVQALDTNVTLYARNITFLFNWLLVIFVYSNVTVNAAARKHGSKVLKRVFRTLVKLQSLKENLTFFIHCIANLLVTSTLLFYLALPKYQYRLKRTHVTSEKLLILFLLFPFIILLLVSNMINVSNLIVRQLLMINRNEFRTKTRKREAFAVNYAHIHELFEYLNNLNAINFVLIISFCGLNIVYEVSWYLGATLMVLLNFWHFGSGVLLLSAHC